MTQQDAIIRRLGITAYEPVLREMFTRDQQAETVDEIWLTQHQPVFTQGQAGKAEHVLFPGDIPVVQSDRGGQVTITGLGKSPPTCYLICGDWALV